MLVAAVLVAAGFFLLDGILILPAALLFWMALSQLLPAMAYLMQRTDGMGGRLFRKKDNGTIPALWLLAYLPFVISRYVNVVVVRVATREPAATDVGYGVLVGGRILPWDRSTLAGHGVSAVLDVCAEIPRDPGTSADARHYLAVPVLDASGPTVQQLSHGVSWALDRLKEGEIVLVQCTLGHGRSATFVAGLLLATGVTDTVDDSVDLMRSKRQHVGLNRPQRASLERALQSGAIPSASSPVGWAL
jgi:hypothetical protein